MTIKRFLLASFIEWLALFGLKVLYFREILDSGGFGAYLYYALCAFATLILVRRIGVINYLEALFVCGFWLAAFVFFDLLFASAVLGTEIFRLKEYWFGFLAVFFVAFFFHKKRHVDIRRRQQAHRHGHH